MIFLRPWFLVLAFVPLIFWIFKRHLSADNPLAAFVDKRLLPYLTVRFDMKTARLKTRWFTAFWLILVIAGAGPAFHKITVPADVSAPAGVIVLDLSPAMSGQNLTRAKLKLYDLVKAFKGRQLALVLYDEKGYTAVPLTADLGVIENMIPTLDPAVMPRQANRPAAGLKQAANLLKNAGLAEGQIIFMTAGGFDAQGLEQAAEIPYKIVTLGIENEGAGYPVPLVDGDFMRDSSGAPVLVKPDKAVLRAIGDYIPVEAGEADVLAVLSKAPDKAGVSNEVTGEVEVWSDAGPYLLLGAAVLFALLFRKGVLFLLMFGMSVSAEAGLFERPDQEKYHKMAAGVEAYRIGNYEAARQFFESGDSADDFYNEGNARAHLNDIEGAIQAYEKALQKNPTHPEALYNKAYLERQRPPKEQQEDSQESDNADTQQPQQNPAASSEQTNDTQQDNTSASKEQGGLSDKQSAQNQVNGAENEPEQQGKSLSPDDIPMSSDASALSEPEALPQPIADNQVQKGAETDFKDVSENENPKQPDENEIQSPITHEMQNPSEQPIDQDSEQIFNKIKQDPSRLLKYRLYQQYMRQQ